MVFLNKYNLLLTKNILFFIKDGLLEEYNVEEFEQLRLKWKINRRTKEI